MTTAVSVTTLLIIDVQEAVLADCADVEGVLARIDELTGRARRAGAAVVYVQHSDPEDPEMARGSRGWQLAARLERVAGDPVIAKTYRDSFADTGLGAILSSSKTTRLVMVGTHSDYCVRTTALSALTHGYDVTLVSDAHTAQAAELPEGTVPAPMVGGLDQRAPRDAALPGANDRGHPDPPGLLLRPAACSNRSGCGVRPTDSCPTSRIPDSVRAQRKQHHHIQGGTW
jgi:nicotinamidase-related amidase